MALSRLIDADVVNFHSLRPDRVVDSMRAAPRAANRDVKNQMKRFVERPLPVVGGGIRPSFIAEREVLLVVDVPAYLLGRPLHRIHIEFSS